MTFHARPSERLVVSWPSQSAAGEERRPSFLVERLRRLFTDLRVTREEDSGGAFRLEAPLPALEQAGRSPAARRALAALPEELMDYVTLHELVHFVHPDHGPGFYGLMDRLMPDWRQRRKELRRYGGALAG